MRGWAWAGVLLGLVAGVLHGAPASWLAQAVAAATQDRVRLQAASGTVWQGQARLVLADGATATQALPGWLAWSIEPHRAGLTLRLKADCCTDDALRIDILPSLESLRVACADAQSHWPAGLLAGLGGPWNTIAVQGRLQLQTQQLAAEWSDGHWRWSGAARIDASDMASRLSTLRPLGDYRLRVDAAAAGGPAVQLETLSGSLLLSGDGQWSGSQWRFRGEARAEPQAQEALENLLNILGRRDGARSVMTSG